MTKARSKPPRKDRNERADLVELARKLVDPRTALDFQKAANDPRSPLFKQMAAIASEKHLDQEERVLRTVEFLANLSIDEKERLQAEIKVVLMKEERAALQTRDAQVQAEAQRQQQIINQMIEQQRQEIAAKEQHQRTAEQLKEISKGLVVLAASIAVAQEEVKEASKKWDAGREAQTNQTIERMAEKNIVISLPNSEIKLTHEDVARIWNAEPPAVPLEKKMEYNPALKEFMQKDVSQAVNHENLIDQFKKVTAIVNAGGKEFAASNLLAFVKQEAEFNKLMATVAKENGPANEKQLRDLLDASKKLDNLTTQYNMQNDKYHELNGLLTAQLFQMHPEMGQQLMTTWRENKQPVNTQQLASEKGVALVGNMNELDRRMHEAEKYGGFTPENQVKVADLINKISKQEAELGIKAKGSLIHDLSSVMSKDHSADEKLDAKVSVKSGMKR